MIRVILEKIEEKLAQYHQDNKLVKAVMCVCKCCFWCLEKFMKFLNRNAYIMCAVSGNNFCTSAKDAFFLLLRNAARLAVLTGVVNFLMFLSKIVVVGLCAALSYVVFSGQLQVCLKHIIIKGRIKKSLTFVKPPLTPLGLKRPKMWGGVVTISPLAYFFLKASLRE